MRKFTLLAATALAVSMATSMGSVAFAQTPAPAQVRPTQGGDSQGAVRPT